MTETITIVGNLGAEPESRGTPGGVPIASFRVGTTQRRLNKQTGQWENAGTSWYGVSAYRQLAQHVLASLHKGQRVVVTGRFKLREWENANGKGLSADIDADAVGHDLLWGTTVFHNDGRNQAAPPPDASWSSEDAPPPEESWATVTPPDGPPTWNTPLTDTGVTATTAETLEGTGEEPRERVLVGADETPF